MKILDNFISKALSNISQGLLILTLPSGEIKTFGESGLSADLTIHSYKAIRLIIQKGDVGFAEAYFKNYWSTNNILILYEVLVANLDAMQKQLKNNTLSKLLSYMRHLLRFNSISGSKKNIHAHYDLGNDFFFLWLDKSKTYSSALFESINSSLEDAQKNKYQAILNTLNLPRGSSILEIGCGWGGFMELAGNAGYRVDGLTISEEQFKYSSDRLKSFSGCSVIFEDYRNHFGKYDAIVSIEMFEAVGSKYWNTFMDKVSSLLRSGSRAVIQVITIRDDLLPQYLRSADFIKTYIFPGGELIGKNKLQSLALEAGLKLEKTLCFGKDYAKTLEHWYLRFKEVENTILTLGFDKRFIDIWETYLAYCRGGFLAERIDVGQFSLIKE
ncbi:MAG: cyclopropane-fatty-acyl-phospholipid synthase family protein [Gammaproteobacteria bacterium]